MKYTKVYQENRYSKELVGYQCEKGYIEIEYDITLRGAYTKWYVISAFRGSDKPSAFNTLKEAKQALENN